MKSRARVALAVGALTALEIIGIVTSTTFAQGGEAEREVLATDDRPHGGPSPRQPCSLA
jgi:hypothetical protein